MANSTILKWLICASSVYAISLITAVFFDLLGLVGARVDLSQFPNQLHIICRSAVAGMRHVFCWLMKLGLAQTIVKARLYIHQQLLHSHRCTKRVSDYRAFKHASKGWSNATSG